METTTLQDFKLIGIKLPHKTTNQNGQSAIDCGNFWQKFESGNYIERIPGKLSGEIYAVYFDYDGDHLLPYAYFIGYRVEPDTITPSDMESLTIPQAVYTKITAKGKMPDCVANTWKEIWQSDIDRAYQYDFEIYGEKSADWQNAEVDVFLSINV